MMEAVASSETSLHVYRRINKITLQMAVFFRRLSWEPQVWFKNDFMASETNSTIFVTGPSSLALLSYIFIVGVGGYGCNWLHSMSHTRCRTPLDKGSACGKYLVLTSYNTYKRQATMPRQDSNLQFQKVRGLGPTTWPVRLPALANMTCALNVTLDSKTDNKDRVIV